MCLRGYSIHMPVGVKTYMPEGLKLSYAGGGGGGGRGGEEEGGRYNLHMPEMVTTFIIMSEVVTTSYV